MQKIRLDTRTINVLKNFASINQSLLVRPGSVISTISSTKTILASATVDVEFQTSFAIYDLSKFLSVMSLFENPDIEIGSKSLSIVAGPKRLNYTFADPSTIVTPPEKSIVLPSADVSFKLTSETLSSVMRAAGVLGLPEVAVVGDGQEVSVRAVNSTNPSGDVFSVTVGDTSAEFSAIYRTEHLKLLPGDYDVTICSRGISQFEGSGVTYFIALEASSKF
jgi:hypothetical protein